MRPVELRVLLAALEEHVSRDEITTHLNAVDDSGAELDQREFRRLNDRWLVSRDALRLAQTGYVDWMDRQWHANRKLDDSSAALQKLQEEKTK